MTIACVLVLSGAAGAQTMEQMRAVYAQGRFVEAAELGAALKTSESHALAAQSLAMQGHFFAKGDEKKALFERAVELAREAVRLDTANPGAHIQPAHATGRYAQAIGFLQAVAGGYATKVRESIEEALPAVGMFRTNEGEGSQCQVRCSGGLTVQAMAAEPLGWRLFGAHSHQQTAQGHRQLERRRQGYLFCFPLMPRTMKRGSKTDWV